MPIMLSIHKQNLKKAYQFITEDKRYIYFASVVFIIGIIAGLLMPEKAQMNLLDNLINFIENITANKTPIQLFFVIFFNNLKVNLYVVLFGIFLGIFPFLVLLVNGIAIGVISDVFSRMIQAKSCLWIYFVASLLPHGIIEIPAFIISAAMGFRIGKQLILPEIKTGKWKRFRSATEIFKKSMFSYVYIILLLVFAAALIETFVTPIITIGIGNLCEVDIASLSLSNMTG